MPHAARLGVVVSFSALYRGEVEIRAWLRRYRVRVLSAVPLVAALCLLPLLGHRQHGEQVLSWWSLLPPSIALVLVLLTRRVFVSLVSGVLVGSLLHHGVVWGVPRGLDQYFWANATDSWHLLICGFALTVLGMVKVTEASGGVMAVVQLLSGRLSSARATKVGTAVGGLLVFFDDYANTFLIGSSMRPLCDRHGVSREKLAYIVDSTAAPVAGLAIVSTWLSYEVGLLGEITAPLELPSKGYALLLLALPMRFYCLFALVLVFAVAILQLDLGPMVAAERAASDKVRASESAAPEQLPRRVAWNAILPISTLVLCIVVGLVFDGGGLSHPAWLTTLGGWQQILAAADDSTLVLFCSALVATLVAVGTALASGQLDARTSSQAFVSGLRKGSPALGILFCAWALGAVCKDLSTGPFIVEVLEGQVSPGFVPLLTFGAASLVALATGTSWGTMAILMPAALPLSHQLGGLELMLPTLAAVLDGAIFGDHCSPVSDTTVLSATACDCSLLAHVWTQLPYALLAMAVAALGYLAVGALGLPLAVPLLAGPILLVGALAAFGQRPHKRERRG